jgi:plastocyanin
MRRWKTKKNSAANVFRIAILATAALSPASGALGRRFVATAEEKPKTNAVTIDNFSFAPMQLEVPAGTQVTWINKDDVPHTVVSLDHTFKSRALDTDESFSFTFQTSGTYEYFCSVHPKMTGRIIVK